MPVFRLTSHIIFPHPNAASPEGVLAIGGDLSPERLLEAYRCGIFPWYSEQDPIIWWSPDPRCVLFPHEIKISHTMRQILRQKRFTITFDHDFPAVIASCQKKRAGQEGTWITEEMKEAYIKLHKLGYAHSVEAWSDGVLAGGLYGISLGRCFFGESMFSQVSNASKAAFITLVKVLQEKEFGLIDCQTRTDHLVSLGAKEIPRPIFLTLLRHLLSYETYWGDWRKIGFYQPDEGRDK